LQQEISKAQQELGNLTTKLRAKNAETKHAQLTFAELSTVPDEATAYTQVGKMFLMQPLPELKAELQAKHEQGTKEVAAMTEKKGHMEEVPQRPAACAALMHHARVPAEPPAHQRRASLARSLAAARGTERAPAAAARAHSQAYKKVQEDFQEFVKAHVVEEGAEKKEKEAADAE
jgi:chaperonin cofactor prefoldin